jgi:hypothetical protein
MISSDAFTLPMPRGLREQASGMSWGTVIDTFAPRSGPWELRGWECRQSHDRTRRRLGQAHEFRATLALGGREFITTATAGGPVGALTAMLYEHGVLVETLEFHQAAAGESIATFVRGGNGIVDRWAMGLSADATQSALEAIIACTNRLGG